MEGSTCICSRSVGGTYAIVGVVFARILTVPKGIDDEPRVAVGTLPSVERRKIAVEEDVVPTRPEHRRCGGVLVLGCDVIPPWIYGAFVLVHLRYKIMRLDLMMWIRAWVHWHTFLGDKRVWKCFFQRYSMQMVGGRHVCMLLCLNCTEYNSFKIKPSLQNQHESLKWNIRMR